jgi:hypothetical protein
MFKFLFGNNEEPSPPPPPKHTTLIKARNEVGELVLMEVAKPIRNVAHPKLSLHAFPSRTFLNYDNERDRR